MESRMRDSHHQPEITETTNNIDDLNELWSHLFGSLHSQYNLADQEHQNIKAVALSKDKGKDRVQEIQCESVIVSRVNSDSLAPSARMQTSGGGGPSAGNDTTNDRFMFSEIDMDHHDISSFLPDADSILASHHDHDHANAHGNPSHEVEGSAVVEETVEETVEEAVEETAITGQDENGSVCKTCGVGFKRKHDLKRHIQTIHMGARQYKCDSCGALFKRKHHMENHVRQMHEVSPIVNCNHCGKPFTTDSSRRRHIRLVHKSTQYE